MRSSARLSCGIFGRIGKGTSVKPSFACDHGYNVVGDNAFINFNAVILELPGRRDGTTSAIRE